MLKMAAATMLTMEVLEHGAFFLAPGLFRHGMKKRVLSLPRERRQNVWKDRCYEETICNSTSAIDTFSGVWRTGSRLQCKDDSGSRPSWRK